MLGIDSLDTRALTRHIRTAGAMRAVISQTLDPAALVERAKQAPKMEGQDLVSSVATDRCCVFLGKKTSPCPSHQNWRSMPACGVIPRQTPVCCGL
ncbi:MAG: hypothetical protein R2875_05390 [Desulfobacterales bacterium]